MTRQLEEEMEKQEEEGEYFGKKQRSNGARKTVVEHSGGYFLFCKFVYAIAPHCKILIGTMFT